MDWIGQVALATLVVGLFAWLRADIAALRKELVQQGVDLRSEISGQANELRGEFADLRRDVTLLQKEVASLRERMAHMEGLLDGLREAIVGRQVA